MPKCGRLYPRQIPTPSSSSASGRVIVERERKDEREAVCAFVPARPTRFALAAVSKSPHGSFPALCGLPSEASVPASAPQCRVIGAMNPAAARSSRSLAISSTSSYGPSPPHRRSGLPLGWAHGVRRDQLLDPGDEPRQRLRRRLTTEHSATKQLRDLGQHFLSPLARCSTSSRRRRASVMSSLAALGGGRNVKSDVKTFRGCRSRPQRSVARFESGDRNFGESNPPEPNRRPTDYERLRGYSSAPMGSAPAADPPSGGTGAVNIGGRRHRRLRSRIRRAVCSRKGLILWVLRGFCPPSTTSIDSVKRTLQIFT